MKDISVKNLSVVLDGAKILDDISFSVPRGVVHGFLGPNGAGKTTTMKCLLGIIEKYEGTIEILGKKNISHKIKSQIGFMAENTYLYKFLSGRELLDFYGSFFIKNKKNRLQKVDFMLDMVGLTQAADKRLSKYSKGMLQRAGIAQALMGDPQILFLDEPMSGLDPLGRRDIREIILDLKKQGKTVFFNSHILADVQEICDTFSILHKGKMAVSTTKVIDLSLSLEDFFIESIEKISEKN